VYNNLNNYFSITAIPSNESLRHLQDLSSLMMVRSDDGTLLVMVRWRRWFEVDKPPGKFMAANRAVFTCNGM
jgi:hypothetical protein